MKQHQCTFALFRPGLRYCMKSHLIVGIQRRRASWSFWVASWFDCIHWKKQHLTGKPCASIGAEKHDHKISSESNNMGTVELYKPCSMTRQERNKQHYANDITETSCISVKYTFRVQFSLAYFLWIHEHEASSCKGVSKWGSKGIWSHSLDSRTTL